jgi:hypothetical protein
LIFDLVVGGWKEAFVDVASVEVLTGIINVEVEVVEVVVGEVVGSGVEVVMEINVEVIVKVVTGFVNVDVEEMRVEIRVVFEGLGKAVVDIDSVAVAFSVTNVVVELEIVDADVVV